MAIRGLKTKIGFNVILLLLLSAVITDVLVITVVQNVWVRTKIEQDRCTIQSLGQLFLVTSPLTDNEAVIDRKQVVLSTLLADRQFQALYISDRSGTYFFRSTRENLAPQLINDNLLKAVQTNTFQQVNIGLVRSVFWWYPQSVLVAAPIPGKNGKPQGGIAALILLTPVYQKLGQYNKPVFLYILLNTAILTIVGLYRIFRIYLHPIDRIIDQANRYHDDADVLFLFRREDSELNRLSSALNHMLQRISDDKEKLRHTVASLERTNDELKRAQNEVIRAEKMASVGRLASGIAHEIGNPIGIVLGYLDLLAQPDLSDDERKDFLQRADKEIQRINTIIRQLLDFARAKGSTSQNVSVHAILDELVTIMRMQPIMADIEIHCALHASNDVVWADSDQLRQVFLNLMLNAADAIKSDAATGKGRVEIRTADLGPIPDGAGDHLEVIIEDNGPGIPHQDRETVFDPFFTTKEPGKGTGLGLAVSYTIIEQMGGTISVHSPEGKGAAIKVVLSSAESGHIADNANANNDSNDLELKE